MANQTLILVAISGCSSSGKTTIAKLTASAIPGCAILHEDDFYKADSEIPIDKKYGVADWDCAEALRIDDLKQELSNIKETGNIKEALNHDDETNGVDKLGVSPEEWRALAEKYKKLTSLGARVVILDGFMIFNDEELMSLFDVRILIRAPYETMKRRRAERGGYRTSDSFWVDPPFYFDEFVYKAYEKEHKHLFVNECVEESLKPDLGIIELENGEDANINTILNCISDSILSRAESSIGSL